MAKSIYWQGMVSVDKAQNQIGGLWYQLRTLCALAGRYDVCRPNPPPPGVRILIVAPGAGRVLNFDGRANSRSSSIITFSPGAPASPPCRPQGR